MEYLALGIIGFVVGLSGAMLPRPMLVYTISHVLQGRARNALWIVLGHIFVEIVMNVRGWFGWDWAFDLSFNLIDS